MRARSIKRVLTVALATTMVLGSSMSAFAANGESEGTGEYEGGEMQYPTLSITLPVIPDHTYDYIADPNGLISATAAAHYGGATFTGTSGIFFKTTEADGDVKAIYTNKSKAQEVTNQNAQDVDITVKLEQLEAGDESIVYSDTATFETEDTANKLYLAVTDDAASDAQVSALSATTAATLTTTVPGVPDNYKPNWDETNGYGYVLKDAGELEDWETCSYILTGALNTNATWGDDVTFPSIKVTWSYAEHTDGVAITGATKVSGQAYGYTATFTKGTALNLSATGLTAATWASDIDGEYKTSANITVSNGTATIAGSNWGSAQAGDNRYLKLVIDGEEYIVKITVATE
jgi:hypothetical protein